MVPCKEQQQIKSPILGISRIKKNKALSSDPSDYSGPCAAPPIHSAEHLSWGDRHFSIHNHLSFMSQVVFPKYQSNWQSLNLFEDDLKKDSARG